LVKEHGAAVIGLCMDEDGIPPDAGSRLAVAGKIIERADKLGIPIEDVVIDPLALTMGADSTAGRIALDTVAMVRDKFGVNITMGASNISFGLPDRHAINSTFIAMAIHAGMTCPITNPLVADVRLAVLAADLAMGRDDYGMNWIKAYRERQKDTADS
jgi:5-methyltetrahydrofolate--homocysteine methyltransferase